MNMPDVSIYTPISAPPLEVVQMMEEGLVEVTRRLEFYESDAITRWHPGNSQISRLVDGSIPLDYNGDERRKLDVTLENSDNALRPDPNGGFWYDKVIKVFRGVRYPSAAPRTPTVLFSTSLNRQALMGTANRLQNRGHDPSLICEVIPSREQIDRYSVIVAQESSGTNWLQQASLLRDMFESGKTVVTIGGGIAGLPHYTGSGALQNTGVAPVSGDNPAMGAFTAEAYPSTVADPQPTGVTGGAQRIAAWPATGTPQRVTAALLRGAKGGFWFDIRMPSVMTTQTGALFSAMLTYMKTFNAVKTWEIQQGEFFIDRIDTESFPDQVKVTARDATKKLMNDKIDFAVAFPADTFIKDLVIGQLALAGIPVSKMRITMGNERSTTEMSFAAGTSRWEIIKSALDSFGYERYFDNEGCFVVRKFRDPSTSPSVWEFKTGSEGNLVSYDRSVNDSNIYNKVVVTSPPADGDVNPVGYYGVAEVTDVNAPTHKSKIGNRPLPIEAAWATSDLECAQLASERLKIAALESYEINFSSLYYSWIEVGEIVTIKDPDALPHEPDRFLLDSLSLPLGLGAMSGTGKRVTFVGSSGN